MNKYRNEPKIVDGISFASKAEARRYTELKAAENLGAISGLMLQHTYILLPSQRGKSGKYYPAIKYIADFVYTQDGEIVVEDVKGFRTPLYMIKKKLMLYFYHIEIQEVRR